MHSKVERYGLLLGLVLGVLVAMFTGNFAMWIAVGVALGLLFSRERHRSAQAKHGQNGTRVGL